MMEVMVTTGAISRTKLPSNRHHQQTNIQLFTGQMSFLSPNQQCQSIEGKSPKMKLKSWIKLKFKFQKVSKNTLIYFIPVMKYINVDFF